MSSTRPPGYDDRFVVPMEASRRGAHRARVSPFMAALPYLAVAAVAIGGIVIAWTLLSGSIFGSSPSSADGGSTNGGAGSTSGSTTPAGNATSNPSSSVSVTQTESSSPTESATTSGAANVDQTVALTVLNGTANPQVSGLAAKVKAKLTIAGWTNISTSTLTGTRPSVTTVYYGSADLKPAALALVSELGVGKAKLSSARAGTGITIVITNDYQA